jgi:hypothetical protein
VTTPLRVLRENNLYNKSTYDTFFLGLGTILPANPLCDRYYGKSIRLGELSLSKACVVVRNAQDDTRLAVSR